MLPRSMRSARRFPSDDRMRSKWSRVLRYAAEFKNLDEELGDFIKRRGGLNRCAARFARRPPLHRSDSSLVRPHRFPIDGTRT
jgi:hypothetical protein